MKSFEITASTFLSTSILMSILKYFDRDMKDKDTADDYYPQTQDKPLLRKCVWYLSQVTFQSQILLTAYFIFDSMNINSTKLLMTVAPACLAVNIQYFLLIFPRENTKIFKLEYATLLSHGLNTIFIILKCIDLPLFPIQYLFYHFRFMGLSTACLLYTSPSPRD